MARFVHGQAITTDSVQAAAAELSKESAEVPLAFATVKPVDLQKFDYMFPALQADPANLLPEDPTTAGKLVALGRAMHDPGGVDPGDAGIPAAYTYFGQFVDHDITLDAVSATLPELLDPNLTPMTVNEVRTKLHNLRTATLDLDNLYSPPAPRDPIDANRMMLGVNAPIGNRPPGKDVDNDVPREGPNPDPAHDRAALIGDPRNDENTIVAQMQVAFLKAHNALVAQGMTFDQARTTLRQHYQYVVVHDFLSRIADPAVVADILQQGPKVFDPSPNYFFMPLEFAVATYRFGHSMIRATYNFNLNFQPATLDLLFVFTSLTGGLGGFDTLPENWIVEWENLVDAGQPFDRARRIDTKLVEPLFHLKDLQGVPEFGDGARLAVRNLLRGYLLRMPTGQAVAAAMGIEPLKPVDIQTAAGSPEQVQALNEGGFLDRTPLWYYVLVEAAALGDGQRLGPVGSRIVAEVLISVARRSADSIFDVAGWQPTLPSVTAGTFELRDLLVLAGVLSGTPVVPTARRTYLVVAGDTLFGIAESQLGDGNRWPQVFALNRDEIADPDVIFPGQVLELPDPASTDSVPRVYKVNPGDTLSAIAADRLGDANRWPEIFEMNRAVIRDPDLILPGQFLLLPAA